VRVVRRVAAAVAVVSFLAIGLHGRVAKTLEKVTVSVSDDGLAWIGRTRCSPVCALVVRSLDCWGDWGRVGSVAAAVLVVGGC